MAAMPWTQRDVSWLQFNERVLAQAMRADRPLLERCRFLGITAENLDEFIAVRLAKRRSKPDTAEKRRIDLVLQRSVETFVWRQQACWEQLKEQLAAVGIRLLSEKQWDIRQRQATAEIFQTRIMPLLTPFTVDAAHPFPYLASGQLAIALLQPHKPEMVVLPLPVSLPRLFSLPCDNGRAFVLLEDVVQRFLFARFPEEPGRQMTVFRLLRSAAETLLRVRTICAVRPGNCFHAGAAVRSYGWRQPQTKDCCIRFCSVMQKQIRQMEPPLVPGWICVSAVSLLTACRCQPFAGRHGAVHRQRISGEKRTRSLPYGGVIAWPFIRLKILTASFVFCSRLQPIPRFG